MHRIKAMKDKLIKEAQNRMDNLDGGSIEQMGQIIDMIKDLSEAEKSCLEAEYYDTVIDAMDGSDGYDGYRGQNSGGRSGGRSGRGSYGYDDDMEGYRNSKGQYARKPGRRRMRRYGYSDDSIDNLREMIEESDPERKKQLKRDLQDLMQEM